VFVLLLARFSGSATANDQFVLHGHVVDEQGQPVAGIHVRSLRWDEGQSAAVTGKDGAFDLPVPRTMARFLPVIAASKDGSGQGYAQYSPTGAALESLSTSKNGDCYW
jgi:hypothetical protein